MSAHQQMKRMLDELMGTCRNGEHPNEKLEFTNPRVCKNFLLYCCPYDLLSATRCDLGPCPKVHNFAIRADYEKASTSKDYDFQMEVLQNLRGFLSESERRATVAKKRLKITQEVLTIEDTVKRERVTVIDSKMKKTLAEAEKLGAEGNVEESLKLMETVEEMQNEKEDALEDLKKLPSSLSQQQKLRACDICSSFLGLEDNDRRLADHFNGRLHLGYLFIRNKVEELENSIQEKFIKKYLDAEFGTTDGKKPESRSPSPEHRSHKHRHHRSHTRDKKSRRRRSSSSDEKRSDRSRSREKEAEPVPEPASTSQPVSQQPSIESVADIPISTAPNE